jgi:HK97 family phage prohead protease
MIEHKTLALDVKAVDDDAGTVEFYALAFGNRDRQGEVIEPGAVKNVDEFVRDGWIALNHDWNSLPVASIESASQDGRGLYVKAAWHSTPEAQAARTVVRERMSRGKAVKASIGYKVLDDDHGTSDGQPVRTLKSIELYEASLVNLPANPRAEVMAAKSWAADYELAFAELKEGRAISARRRERLARLRDEIDELLAETEHRPRGDAADAPPITEEDTPVVGDAGKADRDIAARREVARFLALSAAHH